MSRHVFIEFYIFLLDEVHVRGSKLMYEHVWAGNVWENIPEDYLRVVEEGPKLVPKAA